MPCQVCNLLLCPAHRWSTGNPRDGYFCVDSWCIPKQKTHFSIPPWANEIVDAILTEVSRPPSERSQLAPWKRVSVLGGIACLLILLIFLYEMGCT